MVTPNSKNRPYPERRRKYPELGAFLKTARLHLRDPETRRALKVPEVAKLLGVKAGFVYQVEQGIRRPAERDFGQWASVYGISAVSDLWKCIGKIPMDMVAAYKPETRGESAVEELAKLSGVEKALLLPYLDYVRWQTSRAKASAGTHS